MAVSCRRRSTRSWSSFEKNDTYCTPRCRVYGVWCTTNVRTVFVWSCSVRLSFTASNVPATSCHTSHNVDALLSNVPRTHVHAAAPRAAADFTSLRCCALSRMRWYRPNVLRYVSQLRPSDVWVADGDGSASGICARAASSFHHSQDRRARIPPPRGQSSPQSFLPWAATGHHRHRIH
jgi:hypothetical protein